MDNILKYQNPSSPLLPAAIKIGYTYKPDISRSTEVEGATPIMDLQELSKKEKRGLYEAYDFYANDVYPRKQKYNGSYNPKIHNMNNLTKRVIFREPLNFKNGFNRGGYAPIYLPSESSQIPNFLTPIVTRKPRDFGNTVLHEATHAEDGDSFKTDNFKLGESMTDEEVKLLDEAYKFEYEDDMTRAEKQTTNREFRFGLSRLTGLYLDDLTDYINNLSTKELKKLYKKINPGYRELMIKPKYDDNWRDAVKKALIQVGQNTTDQNRIDYRDPVTFAKNGGILKAQEGTGNLYAPHPLSPVGIALNQARAMAKGKTHLPPGVKDVVGPDGKKVAIRIEQPLVPLEQSIAEWLPGTGDVAEVGYIANDVKNGNYGSATLAAAMIALPGNVGKLLSKHRKAVSKTADAVEDAVRKADVSEYINTVDDALPERQPLTIQKSSQFWDGTSKSKLSVDEKMGLPKSERNQPIKSNPNAGVVTNVDTYLINRAYAPWEIRDGKFIFKMGEPINVRGLSERAPITFHFTTDTQVKPHSGGDSWANAKTTYLVPYKSVVKHNGMPANIEPMDTWWTAGSTFEFPTQDVKVLTADPKVYRQYKARGIDVEFSPEGRKLVRERKGMSDIVEQWIRSKQDQFGMRPTVDTYRQMERETGLSSNVRPKKKHLFGDYFEETNVPDYHTGPATHSNSWSFPAMANIGLPDDPKYFMSSIARNVALDLSKYKTFTFKDLPALQKLAQTHKQFDIQLPTTYGTKNQYSWDFSGQEELVDKINKILRGEIVVPYEQGGKL